MKQITVNNKELLLVEVPEEYLDCKIKLTYIQGDADLVAVKNNLIRHIKSLPLFDWQILGSGKASEISEKEWNNIVDKATEYDPFKPINPAHRYVKGLDYTTDVYSCDTATESGHSLLTHHGFKPETTVILIKQ